jgi:two-component system response regulator DegU
VTANTLISEYVTAVTSLERDDVSLKREGEIVLNTVRPIRMFIVDPQPLIATALRHFFEADESFHVTETAQHVRLTLLRMTRPDVLLIAREHGSSDVCDSIAAAKEAVPATKICLLSCHTHPDMLRRVLDAGASGYAVKDVAPGELTHAVKSVARGDTYVDGRIEGFSRTSGVMQRRNRNYNALSERETEIVKLIAEGQSNREISEALGLSEKTIKNHISRIFAKLHITARTQAVVHAIKTGIA